MTEEQITYLMIRAVRDETGASHEECRRVLEESGGDVAGAAALWFARNGPGAPVSHVPPGQQRLNDPHSGRG